MAINPGDSNDNGSLAGRTDVALSGLQSGQVLAYDQISSKWNNRTVGSDTQFYMMPAPNGSNDTDAINAALASLSPDRTRVVQFRSGIYNTSGVTIPAGKNVVFRDVATAHVGDIWGTRLRRTGTGSGPVINATGVASTLSSTDLVKPENRVKFDIHDMDIHGSSSGVGLRIFRGSDNIIENIRFHRAPLGGIILDQCFDARINGSFVGYSGSGNSNPALVVTGRDEGVRGGSKGIRISDCELENNNGIDIMITSASASSPTTAVMIDQLKSERGGGAYSIIEITTGAELQLSNTYLWLGSSSNVVPQIRVSGGKLIGTSLNIKRGSQGSGYAVYQTGSTSLVNLTGVYFESFPSDKSIRVGSDVAPHRLRVAGASMIPSEEQANRLIRDDRSNPGSYKYPA